MGISLEWTTMRQLPVRDGFVLGRRREPGTGNREPWPSIGTVAIPPFVAGAPLGRRRPARDDDRAVMAAASSKQQQAAAGSRAAVGGIQEHGDLLPDLPR